MTYRSVVRKMIWVTVEHIMCYNIISCDRNSKYLSVVASIVTKWNIFICRGSAAANVVCFWLRWHPTRKSTLILTVHHLSSEAVVRLRFLLNSMLNIPFLSYGIMETITLPPVLHLSPLAAVIGTIWHHWILYISSTFMLARSIIIPFQ